MRPNICLLYTSPIVPRLPPNLWNTERTSATVRVVLSVSVSTKTAIPVSYTHLAVLTTLFVSIMLFTHSYKNIERSIIAFVSVIGLSFIYELFLVEIDWPAATMGWEMCIRDREYAVFKIID